MFALDLFNNDYERRLAEGAVDQLEQRRIDDLAMKMDDLVARAKTASTPEAKSALVKEFQKVKAERDSYFKIKDECMGYGGLGEENVNEGAMKDMLWDMCERMERDEFINHCVSEWGWDPVEMGEFWDSINGPLDEAGIGQQLNVQQLVSAYEKLYPKVAYDSNGDLLMEPEEAHDETCYQLGIDPGKMDELLDPDNIAEAGIGQDLITPQQRVQQSTPQKQTPVGKVASTVKNAAKWLAGKGGPGKEGPTYEGKDDAWQTETPWKEIPKAKSGKPVDPRGEVTHLSDVARREAVLKAQAQKKNLNKLDEAQKLHVGDPVVVTAPNEFEGKTGEIYDFSPSGTFVIVDLYNHGKHSMHLSDIAYNEYADQEQDEEDDWYDDADEFGKPGSEFFPEGWQDFNKVEPYAVCLAGKPVKKFDYYEQARRFHDNWKKKLYREGDKDKADKITLMPLNIDEEEQKPYNPNEFRPVGPITIVPPKKLKSGETHQGINDYWKAHGQAPIYKTNEAGNPAQQAAIAIAMKKAGKKPKSVDEDFNTSSLGNAECPKCHQHDLSWEDDRQHVLCRNCGSKFKENEQGVEEGKWNYPKDMTTIPKFDKDADDYLALHQGAKFARKNKADRKEFRKTQKAQAHKELMTGKKEQGVEEVYTPSPAKPFRNPPGFNKQGTGVGNKLAQLTRKEWEEKKKKEQGVTEMDKSQRPPSRHGDYPLGAKGTTVKPTTPKKVVKDLTKVLDKAFDTKEVKEDTGGWIVYDPETQQIKKRFKTHTAGKSYARTHNLGFASSSYYFDNIKEKEVAEVAPPGAKAERMVKHIKKAYSKDGKLTPKEKAIAYATTWKAHNDGKVEEAQTDYQKRRARERDVDAGRPVKPLPRNPQTDYARKRAKDKRDMELGEDQLNELASGYASNKGYDELGVYKRYNTFISKKKFNNLAFIAVAENPRNNEVKFKATGTTPEEAVVKLYAEIDKEIIKAPKVSGAATIDFNVDFVRDILEMRSNPFYAKIVEGPRLIIAGQEMEQYPEIMQDEGFKRSSIRTVGDSENATKLPAMPLSARANVVAGLIANGRYALGQESIDKDGNRIFDLEFDSVVEDPRERIRMGTPAITIATKREVAEESSTASDAVERAILNRIMVAHTDLLKQFGPEKVMQAAEEVAYNVGDIDEIGTSDVSAYVNQVKQILGA